MSANYKPLGQYLFNATASGVVPPVLTPQASDESEQLLAKLLYISSSSSLGGSGSVPNPNASAYQASTVYYTVATGAGTTPANLTSLSVLNNGTGQALFAGQPLPSLISLNFEASPGTKLNTVSYNGSGNSLLLGGTSLI